MKNATHYIDIVRQPNSQIKQQLFQAKKQYICSINSLNTVCFPHISILYIIIYNILFKTIIYVSVK